MVEAVFCKKLNFQTGFCLMLKNIVTQCSWWSRLLFEVIVSTQTAGLQVKPHRPWCSLTHCSVGWLVVGSAEAHRKCLFFSTVLCSLISSKSSCRCCAACACSSKHSVLYSPAKRTCSAEFCWPPFYSQLYFTLFNFCTCNYFVHKTSEWFNFCFLFACLFKNPERFLKFDWTWLLFYKL